MSGRIFYFSFILCRIQDKKTSKMIVLFLVFSTKKKKIQSQQNKKNKTNGYGRTSLKLKSRLGIPQNLNSIN